MDIINHGNNNARQEGSQEIEINIADVFATIVKGRQIIAIALFAAIVLSSIFCFGFMADEFSATTSLYVLNQTSQEVITSSDLSGSALLVNDYREIITSNKVTSAVAEAMGLENLKAFEIKVEAPSNTRIIEITVTGKNQRQVMEVANGLATEFSQVVVSIMRAENVSIIDVAQLPQGPSGPAREKYILIAAMAAAVLSAGILVMIDVLSTSVKSAQDLESKTGLSVLAQIVLITDEDGKDKKRR